MKYRVSRLLSVVLCFLLLCTACGAPVHNTNTPTSTTTSVEQIPPFSGKAHVVIDDNEPSFTKADLVTTAYELYAPLDDLGRCGVATACVGRECMPTEERGDIGQIKPSGWHTVKYDSVQGKYLYNRCHLIGYQLTGENANERNLITGTRYLNIEGMLPFENMIADYVKETNNHVLYRVTPIFDGENLVARGVQMEAKSVEDDGEGVCFNVYAYNSQPGIVIDYATGESRLSDATVSTTKTQAIMYILNTSSKKFHKSSCKNVASIKEKNRAVSYEKREELLRQGYDACKACNP